RARSSTRVRSTRATALQMTGRPSAGTWLAQTVAPQEAMHVDTIDAGRARGDRHVAAVLREEPREVAPLELGHPALARLLERDRGVDGEGPIARGVGARGPGHGARGAAAERGQVLGQDRLA